MTIHSVAVRQAGLIGIAMTGYIKNPDIPHVSIWKIPFLPRRTRVWHARRNNEMLVGIILKHVFRVPLKLVFTSSSPRKRGHFTQFLLKFMDGIVATAQQNADIMPFVTEIVPHGVDTDTFKPGQADVFGIGHDKVIGCFGRVRALKGTHHFVNAMCEILPDNPGWVAIIVGRVCPKHKAYAQELRKKIEAHGLSDRILFNPEVSLGAVAAAYQSLSLYVAPSLLEGFGLTPFEAMASGVPTIATEVGAQGLAVKDTRGGRAVPPDEPEALKAACAEMLEDRDTLTGAGIAARRHIEARFCIKNEAQALVNVYRSLLEAD